MSLRRKYTLSLQHVFAGERLQAFSDAVFSIVVTFMVVPLHTSLDEVIEGVNSCEKNTIATKNLLNDFLFTGEFLRKCLVYLFSFAIILDFWFVHVAIFSIIERVDDIILTLNLLCLLFISFLPFTNILISDYAIYDQVDDSEHLAIALCSGDITIVGSVMVIMLLYGYWKQKLLFPEVVKNAEIRTIQIASVLTILVKPLIAVFTIVVAYTVKRSWVSMIIFYSSIVIVVVVRLAFYFYFKKYKKTLDRLPRHVFKTIASKFRVEFFSDGIFAIVATLIILDITTETGKKISPDQGPAYELSKLMKEEQFTVLSYVISFTLVAFLWFIHYEMLHFIKKLTPMLTIINLIILFLVGGIPFASKLDAEISSNLESKNCDRSSKRISLRILSTLVFLISLAELIFWSVAVSSKKKCMSTEVERYNSEALQFSKIMVLPIISLITYYCAFSKDFIEYHLEALLFMSAPVLYFTIDITFKVYGRCKQRRRLKSKNTHDNPELTNTANASQELEPADSITTPILSSHRAKSSYNPYTSRPRTRALRVQIADDSFASCSTSLEAASYTSKYETEDELDLVLGRERTDTETESDSD